MMATTPAPEVWGYKEWLTVAQIVITIIGMGVGPWLAVRWSLKQFRSQKWWERQQEVYTQLLEDLSVIYSHDMGVMDEIETGNKYMPALEVGAMVTSAKHRIERLSITGAYIISEVTASALMKYQRASYKADAESHPHDACEIESSAAKDCLEVIKKEAISLLS
jgi:hypothetical protein